LGIAILEDHRETVSLRWMRTNLGDSHLSLGYSAPLRGSSLETLLQSKRPRIINDLAHYLEEHPDSRSTKAALADGIRSSPTFPLNAEGSPVGFVFFSSARPEVYSPQHAELLIDMAEELSLIVQFGRLRQFFESNKNYGRFFRTALHDLKAPLATIQGFLQLMQSETWFDSLDQEARDVFTILLKNTQFMFELMAVLSSVTSAEGQKRVLVSQAVRLQPFLAEFARCAELLASQKGMRYVTEYTLGLTESCRFEPHSIRQVLDNLLTNAIKFSYPGAMITLRVRGESKRLIFSLEDQGPGIPLEEQPKLFREFGKTSVRPTAGESSTGLGLAIAQRIVAAHGGTISVESAVGTGSTFSFWLPIETGSDAAAAADLRQLSTASVPSAACN
jgi:signal transduction histidine kinase